MEILMKDELLQTATKFLKELFKVHFRPLKSGNFKNSFKW